MEDVGDFCHRAEPLPLNGAEMCTEDGRATVTTPHIFSSNEGNRREKTTRSKQILVKRGERLDDRQE